MEEISYVLSTIAIILGIVEPFGKKMKTILVLNFTGNLLVGSSYLMVGEMSGTAICFVACVQVFINYIFDSKEKKIPLYMIVIYAASFLSVNIITFTAWYNVLSLIAAMLFVISVAQSNPKYYRMLYILNSSTWIIYDLLSGAYGNLITHVILFVFIFISIIIRDGKKRITTPDL